MVRIVERVEAVVRLQEFNANHDSHGKFASGHGVAVASGAEQELIDGQSEWRKGLSDADVKAIGAWRGDEADAIGQYLRHGYSDEISDIGSSEAFKNETSALDHALKGAKLPADMTLYRGLEDEHPNWVGRTIRDKSFVSTTIDRSEANTFASYGMGTVVKISAPKGTPGAYLPGIGGKSHYDAEKEVVMPRGTRFKITGSRREAGHLVLDAEIAP